MILLTRFLVCTFGAKRLHAHRANSHHVNIANSVSLECSNSQHRQLHSAFRVYTHITYVTHLSHLTPHVSPHTSPHITFAKPFQPGTCLCSFHTHTTHRTNILIPCKRIPDVCEQFLGREPRARKNLFRCPILYALAKTSCTTMCPVPRFRITQNQVNFVFLHGLC